MSSSHSYILPQDRHPLKVMKTETMTKHLNCEIVKQNAIHTVSQKYFCIFVDFVTNLKDKNTNIKKEYIKTQTSEKELF